MLPKRKISPLFCPVPEDRRDGCKLCVVCALAELPVDSAKDKGKRWRRKIVRELLLVGKTDMTILLLFVWRFHLPSSLWASWWASVKVLLCVQRLIKGQVPMHGMKLSLSLIELSCKRNLEIYQGCLNTGGSLMQAYKTSFKGLLWICHTGNCFLTEVLEKSSSKRWGYTLASLPRMTLPLLDHLQNPDHCQAKHKYLWPLFPLSNCAPSILLALSLFGSCLCHNTF